MRTLSRYLVARFVQLFFVITFIAVASITIVELLLNLDAMLAWGEGWRGALGYLAVRLASEYASYIVPVTAFLAAFLTAALLAWAHEWTAMKTGGLALAAIATPLLGCGTFLALATALFHESVVVEARRAWTEARDDAPMLRFRSGAFWVHRSGWILRVADADEATGSLTDVRIFERDDDGALRRSIAAASASIDDTERWTLHQARVREYAHGTQSGRPHLRTVARLELEMTDPPERAWLRADATALSLGRLREYIAAREARGSDVGPQRALLHARITDWLAIPLLVALAIPIGLATERTRSLGRSAAIATAAIAGFYALRSVAMALAVQSVAPPAVVSVGLAGALAAAAAAGLARAPR